MIRWVRAIRRSFKPRSEESSRDDLSPHLQGRYDFERLFGDLATSRRLWQSIAGVALVANVALVIGFVLVARAQRTVPYVVEVDALGEVRASQELTRAQPPERAIQVALRHFVHNLRTVPSDVNILNVQLARAQSFVSGDAVAALLREVRGEGEKLDRMLRRGDTRYVEEISSVLGVPGAEGLYRITWREVETVGSEPRLRGYEGHFKVRVLAPESPEILLENPLGIFVTDYMWSHTSGNP